MTQYRVFRVSDEAIEKAQGLMKDLLLHMCDGRVHAKAVYAVALLGGRGVFSTLVRIELQEMCDDSCGTASLGTFDLEYKVDCRFESL